MRATRTICSALLCALAWLPAGCGQADGPADITGLLQDDGPLVCPADTVTGRGLVWRGPDPTLLEERALPCLTGDGTLSGHFLEALSASRGEQARSDDHIFLYGQDDERLNQVQAYYVLTHMANWTAARLTPAGDYTASLELIRSDRVLLDYGKPDVESNQLCYALNQGMQGFASTFLNVDVFAHEFAHHLVFSLNRQIENGMIHEALADYLAASFTRDSVVEPSEWPGFDRDLENDHRAPDDVITKGAYCDLLLGRMEADGVTADYPSLASIFAQCRDQNPQEPEHHWASLILSAALWELRERIGEPLFQPMLYRVLHAHAVADTGELMDRLAEDDLVSNQGRHAATIQFAFATRGIDRDLELPFPDIPYAACP